MGPYSTTALYGYTRNNGKTWHGGVDITCPDQPIDNTNVYAVESGTVTQSRIVNNGVGSGTAEWGNYVTVLTTSGLYMIYAHLASRAVLQGQQVEAGQLIGVMGNTGNAAGGYKHVHFEVRQTVSGTGINPTPYLGIENAVGIYGATGGNSAAAEDAPTGNTAHAGLTATLPTLTVGPMSAGDLRTLQDLAAQMALGISKLTTLTLCPVSAGDMQTLRTKAQALLLGFTVTQMGQAYSLAIGPMSAGDFKTIADMAAVLQLQASSMASLLIGPVSAGDAGTVKAQAAALGLPVTEGNI